MSRFRRILMLLLALGDISAYLLFGGFAGIREAKIRRLRRDQILWSCSA